MQKLSDLTDEKEVAGATTPHGVPIVSTGVGDVVEDETGEEAMLSRIPLLSGSHNKAKYLSYRATGFPVRTACVLADVTQATVMHWRRTDPEFADIEANKLHELQHTVSVDILLLEFDRNFRLGLEADYKVLRKAAINANSLSEKELSIYKAARPHYRPKERIDLENALKPAEERAPGELSITVQVDGETVANSIAKQVGYQELLKKFEVNKETAQLAERTVEGEYEVVDDKV